MLGSRFECKSGEVITYDEVCDGVVNCNDGSADEASCLPGNFFSVFNIIYSRFNIILLFLQNTR